MGFEDQDIVFVFCAYSGCEEFKYLGVKTDKEDRKENDIKNSINKGRAVTAMLNSVLWNRQVEQ